ncbi:hypothetical protein MY3296_008325 [Beauveria thailandica]
MKGAIVLSALGGLGLANKVDSRSPIKASMGLGLQADTAGSLVFRQRIL